jgi:sugar O-acyltransferase (sialic acid O-acetyltransferase NeuD family)
LSQEDQVKQQVQASPGHLVIYGAWYYGQVIAETATMCGWNVAGFIDPDPPEWSIALQGYPGDADAFVAIGDNALRAAVSQKLQAAGRRLVTICHPSASVSPSAAIGIGCYIAENATVRTKSHVATGSLLNSGSVVSHDCHVGEFVSFGPNAAIAGHVQIGNGTLLGVGASVRPHCQIGQNCTIGAGAAVIGNLTANQFVGGVPAKPITPTIRPERQSDWQNHQIW